MMKDILVIDDCAVTKETFRKLLDQDYNLLIASNAVDGLGLLLESVSLVFLSLNLPDARGIDVLPQIKREYTSVPVIITASNGTEETCMAAYRRGARDYIKKPLKAEEVLHRVAMLTSMPPSPQKRSLVPLCREETHHKQHHEDIPRSIVNGLMKVKEYIERNYSLPLNLADACRISAINKTYLCRYFKLITGYSFREYQTHIKIQKAKDLMEDPNLSISAISRIVGYPDISYFSTVFKKTAGWSPREYRASH